MQARPAEMVVQSNPACREGGGIPGGTGRVRMGMSMGPCACGVLKPGAKNLVVSNQRPLVFLRGREPPRGSRTAVLPQSSLMATQAATAHTHSTVAGCIALRTKFWLCLASAHRACRRPHHVGSQPRGRLLLEHLNVRVSPPLPSSDQQSPTIDLYAPSLPPSHLMPIRIIIESYLLILSLCPLPAPMHPMPMLSRVSTVQIQGQGLGESLLLTCVIIILLSLFV